MANWVNGPPITRAVFQARLIGPSIITVSVNQVRPGSYNFSYSLNDVGEYMLQIRLTWFTGTIIIPQIYLIY
jgi:hypothetical protein